MSYPAGERSGREHVRGIDPELLVQELRSGRRVTLVDVRSTSEFRGPGGRITGSRSIPLPQLLARRDELAGLSSERLVVVSGRAVRSRLAALELELMGFTEVQSLDGGLERWTALGFPIEHATIPPARVEERCA